jgi:hypothetical protein
MKARGRLDAGVSDELLQVVGSIYDAALCPDGFDTGLASVARFVDA